MINFFKSIPLHIRFAFKSLFRHFAMTLSAASAVTVTLILFSAFLLIAGNVNKFTENIKDDVSIHVVLKADVESEEQIEEAKQAISSVAGVREAIFSDKINEGKLYIEEKGEEFTDFVGEDVTPLHNAFFVSVNDANQLADVTNIIRSLDMVDSAMYGGNSMSQMISMLNSVRLGMIIFMGLLSALAIFLITNTIKMTIYTRNAEIAIMRNVGATNHFIKMPFMIEGMVIGMLGAIIPCVLTYFGYVYFYDMMGGQIITNMFALQPSIPFVIEIEGVLALSGMFVGILGSFISTTRYLRWKR